MRNTLVVVSALLLFATPSYAQRVGDLMGGDLPPEAKSGIEATINDARNNNFAERAAALANGATDEQLEAFFDGAVARVSLLPDGTWLASAKQGGEIVSVAIGKAEIHPGASRTPVDGWLAQAGNWEGAKRLQAVTMTLAAGGREITVKCLNKYRPSDNTISYWVGPMNGLMCLGLEESAEAATALGSTAEQLKRDARAAQIAM